MAQSSTRINPVTLKLVRQIEQTVERDVKVKLARRLVDRTTMQKQEIAEVLGISRETLHRYLKDQAS